MERPQDAGPGAGGRRVVAASASAEAERRRQLQAFLAAKGRLGQGRGGGARSRPYLKDWPNRQNPTPSRANPTARGQKNVVLGKSRKAVSTKDQEKLSAGHIPPVRSSHAKAAPSFLPAKAPQSRGSNPASQHPLGMATKPARKEVTTDPLGTGSQGGQMCFLNHQAKREGSKENRGITDAPPPEKKRAVSWGSLPGPSQVTSKEVREKAHLAPANIPHRRSQAQISHPAEGLAQGRPRDRPGISQRAAPRAPVARPSCRSGGTPCVSMLAIGSQVPRGAKPSRSAPVPVKGELLAGRDHLGQCALQGQLLQHQARGGLAMLSEGRPLRHSLASWRLPKGSSSAQGGISQKRSPGRNKKRACHVPRTPTARSRPPATDHPAAVHTGPPTGHGRGLLQPTARKPRGPQSPSPQDRRKLLEEWLASRRKSYKRPPMILLAQKAKKSPEEKASLNLSFWHCTEDEEPYAQLTLANNISHTLTKCLKLAEEPLQELEDAMTDILKDSNQTLQAAPTQTHIQFDSSPQGQKQGPTSKPISAVKIEVVPLFRSNEHGGKQGVQLLTPVRRSLRIERAAASYPQVLKEHRLVVSSLDEIATSDQESHFLFRNNEALLEGVGIAGLGIGLFPLGKKHLKGTPHLPT